MERPREKFLQCKNIKMLNTEELIAIIVGHGSSKISVFELSELLVHFLRSKINQRITMEELLQFDGIGEVRAMQILSALELGRRFYSSSLTKKLSEEDWDFLELKQSERQYGVHFFHHYTAKFIPQIPSNLIRRLARPNDVVVDPFMGSGTTLVEAKLLGCHSFGLDTNPLAIKIATAKTMVMDESKLEEIDSFLKWIHYQKKHQNENDLSLVSLDLFCDSYLWFREDVAIAIKIIVDKLESYSPEVKNFLQVGLSSLLKGMSNARMDSVTPVLPDNPIYIDRKHYYREVNNLTRNIPVYDRLVSQINRMKYAILNFNKESDNKLKCEATMGDARELSKYIKRCNLVVTSPPYWSAQDYNEIHKLSLNLFGLNTLDGSEIGRKVSSYLNDLELVFREIANILDGYFALVIGEDDKNKYHEKLDLLAQKVGFNRIDIISRRISNQVSRAKQIKREFIYLFKI